MPNGGEIIMEQANIKKEKLRGLFAAHSMGEIEANNSCLLKKELEVETYDKFLEYLDDGSFKKDYLTFKNLREKLDEAAGEVIDLQQVKGCLKLLSKLKDYDDPPGNLDILSVFIKKGLYPNWNHDEKKYYDHGWDMIAVWKHYFLSYTNRNLIETNNAFKDILCNVLGNKKFEENKESVNCVAGLIAHYLKLNNLTAFFDKDNLKCGDMIEKEVFKHCQEVYSFVQLVEPAIFQRRAENKRNWCADEYETFTRWSSQNCLKARKCYYFILTREADKIYPADFPPYFNDWQQQINGHLNIQNLSSLERKDICDKISEIAREIVDTRRKIIEDYTN